MKRVGLIGHGYWGKILHQKLKYLSDIKFICTSEDEYESKLKDVEWVFVATTNESHYEIVKDCILAEKNVFCEKPLTMTYEKSLELVELANSKDVKLFIDEVFWYRSELIDVHKLLSHSPKHIKCVWSKNDGAPHTESFYDLMYHDLYLLQIYLQNKSVSSVKEIDLSNKIHLLVNFDDIEVEFLYDRYSEENTHYISGVNLTRTTEDALAKMIKQVLQGSVIFEYNQTRGLFANKMIDDIKKSIKND